jgi:UDP-N-acetylmuramoylalanyl-D-glutamate--2,6-diaminopimelate ligase (EC 6.3.2.13)
MAAVTGTNGKTSVASFTRQLWTALGHAAINVGTTGVEGAWGMPLAHTTPDSVTLQALLAQAAAAGITHAAMEASSHGLDQRRLEGVRLSAAAFTNLTQDHLDYHPSMEEYFQAKAGLFTRLLPEEGIAVINTDDPYGERLLGMVEQPVLKVGSRGDCDLRILDQRFDAHGQRLRFAWKGRTQQVDLALVGGFQAAMRWWPLASCWPRAATRPRRSAPWRRCRASAGGCNWRRLGPTGRRSSSITRIRRRRSKPR